MVSRGTKGERETRESQKKLDNRRGRNPRKKNGSKNGGKRK